MRQINRAIQFMKKTFANNDKKKIEIRIKYGKGIATSTEVYTHAEPADLVEDLGVFVEREYESWIREPNGGIIDYSHRWRAVKPGKVTVWIKELQVVAGHIEYDANKLPEDYEPYGCYIIDENLTVTYSKEETEAAQERFRKKKATSLNF